MTDFRALCAELARYLQRRKDDEPGWWPEEDPEQALLDRTANALAQPEPQGPTNEELLKLIADKLGYELTLKVGFQEVYGSTEEMVSLLRTAITRWGRPAVEPVSQQEAQP